MISKLLNIKKTPSFELELKDYPIYESLTFGILLAIVGGFLESYTFIDRGGIFANVQTGNIVFFGIYASEGEWQKAFFYIPPIISFSIGTILVEMIKNKFSPKIWTQSILMIEIICLIFVAFIPAKTSTIPLVTILISFISALQTSAFRKLGDSIYATTMSTGNLRSACEEAHKAFAKKDHLAAKKSIRLFIVIFSFLIGAIFSAILTPKFGEKTIFAAVLILIFILIFFIQKTKLKNS